ncbi:MAG: hypothetical protein ACHP7O_04955 [Burkholderiales bacterium]
METNYSRIYPLAAGAAVGGGFAASETGKSRQPRNVLHAKLVSRSHDEIEAAVNRGLAAAMLIDIAAGVVIMRKSGVPWHVSERVLVNPDRRRKSDWQRADLSLRQDA